MIFHELNRGKCKTYLIASERTRQAALIDPLREKVDRYIAALAYFRCTLELIIDTHTHADHRTGTWELHDIVGAPVLMHRRAPAPHVDIHVEDGQILPLGDLSLRILYTPGHTPDGISVYAGDRIFTGDTLLIHGTGRADFAGGDPAAQYDSIQQKIFTLPDETLVFPAHDYRGHTCSTVGEEKRTNPRLAGRSRTQYVDLMNNLGLPLPDKIQEALQANQSAIEDEGVSFPKLAELNSIRQLTASELQARLGSHDPPLVLDVREADEYGGELGHISGSTLMPLRELSSRSGELEEHQHRDVVVVCRAGVRSATGGALLTGLGFDHVWNLKGGMLDWHEHHLPVER